MHTGDVFVIIIPMSFFMRVGIFLLGKGLFLSDAKSLN